MLSRINRINRKKISKDIEDLSNEINQLGPTGVNTTLHPTTAKCIFFSNIQRMFTKIHHHLDYKTNFNKVKRSLVSHSMFLNHNEIKL